MAGYLNRFIDLPFPDLAGTDDLGRALCWVKIRNPRLIPAGDLTAAIAKVQLDDNGRPVNSGAAAEETFGTFAKLVIAGNVWDATWVPEVDEHGDPIDPTAEAPLLPMPPSPADMGKMPIDILNAIGEEMVKANPRQSPAPSSTTTSA